MKQYLFFILIFWSLSSAAQWAGAVIDTLTSNSVREEVNHQCLDKDAMGDLHLLYMRDAGGGGWNFFYRRKPAGLGWMPDDSVTNQFGFSPVLGVHPVFGTPSVAYIQPMATFSEVFVHTGATGVWNTERVTFNGAEDYSPTIDVDVNGIVHLAWIGEDSIGTYKIFYSNNAGATWNTQIIAGSQLGPFGTGAYPVIAVSESGTAHIAYRGGDFGTYHIHYATNQAFNNNAWIIDTLYSLNANDFTASITLSTDSTVHLLLSGNDGWGFPVHPFYMTRPNSTGPFTAPVTVAQGFSGEVGDLFVDQNYNAYCVLNEVSGNIYTGNVIYADALSGWTGSYLISNQATYNADMLIDENGKGHCAAYMGNTFQDQEIIVYGPSPGTSVGTLESLELKVFPNPFSNKIAVTGLPPGNAHYEIMDPAGRKLFSGNHSGIESRFDFSHLSEGVYFLRITHGDRIIIRRLVKGE